MEDGFILLDKPEGLSSNQSIQKLKYHLCKAGFPVKKIGHVGTLDPIATGMLPVCINQATKFSQFLLKADKAYAVGIQLGRCHHNG